MASPVGVEPPQLGLLRWAREELDGRVRAVRERLLGRDFEGRLATVGARYRGGHLGVVDSSWVRRAAMGAAWLHRVHFRATTKGLQRVPSSGCLLVANHSGQLPFDAAVVAASLLLDAPEPRLLRLVHDRELSPRVTGWLARLGALRALPEEVESLLAAGEVLLVFPEGSRGLTKAFSQRYRLQPFTEDFVHWAVRSRAPVVPLSVVGAEEQYLSLGNLKRVASRLGLPALPVIPQMLMPGGALPLPTRYHLEFGEPMQLAPLAESAEHRAWLVRQMIQHQLSRGLQDRRSWWT